MGWMQRNGRILFLLGITFMIISVGAGAFASSLGANDVETPEETATPEATATGEATPTEEVINRQYSAAPEMALQDGVDYQAVIHLANGGAVTIDLLEGESPVYVNNFVFLAKNDFYDGLTFHRVLPGFVAQAGDPVGTGAGGPGYVLPEDTNDIAFERGALSMATSGRGVSGSQFFITLGPTPHLNDGFTVFGWVTEGMNVLDALTPRDPNLQGQPRGDEIADIEILELGAPEGEATPAPTETGEATGTPEPTGTAEATATPATTGTPEATSEAAPSPTATPGQ